LETEWHQNDPYNAINKKHRGYDCVNGCGSVAIAQIMAYHKVPKGYSQARGYENTEYNWTDMINGTATGNKAIGVLMYEIGLRSYSIFMNKETATLRSGVIKALAAMGYEVPEDFKSYNLEGVKSSINAGCPVIADGSSTGIKIFGIVYSTPMGGHYWVIDAYRKMSFNAKFDKSQPDELYTTDYVHCNMGWGGKTRDNTGNIICPNGWYYSGVFDVCNIPYSDDDEKANVNIRSVGTDEKFFRYGLGMLTDIKPK